MPDEILVVDGKTYTKYKLHYHDDGDLILLVGNAAFRVSKSLMAQQSTIFQDMLGFDKASTGSPASQMMVDGMPAVVLHDSEQDIVLLLDSILAPASSDPLAQPKPLETLFRLFSISEKYDAERVTQSALLELNRHLIPDGRVYYQHSKLQAYSNTDSIIDLIDNLKTYNLPQYLSFAYYKLAIWRMTSSNWAQLGRLAPEDRMRIDLGRVALQREVVEMLRALSSGYSHCKNCDYGMPFRWLDGAFGGKLMEDPLLAIDTFLEVEEHHGSSALCYDRGAPNRKYQCWKETKSILDSWQRHFIRYLPGFFRGTEGDASSTKG